MKKVILLLIAIFSLDACTSANKNKNGSNINPPNKDESKSPSLTAPKVRKIWVPEKIEGDKFIEGHYMWVLEKTTSWSQ